MADNTPETGRTLINRGLARGAGPGMDIAMRMAQGQTAVGATKDFVKEATITKLLGPTALWAGSLVGIAKTVSNIVRDTGMVERGLSKIASMQNVEGKFETLLKSATLAKDRLKELSNFRMNSPFNLAEVQQANLLLQRLTRGAFANAAAMRTVGDVAAATGNSFADTAQAVGKVYAAIQSGRSLDRLMFQLQQTGVLTEEAAREMEALEAAGAGATAMWNAFQKSLAFAGGGMQNEMKNLDTLKTKLEAVQATFDKAFAAPYLEAQEKSITASTNAMENLIPAVARLGQELAPLQTFWGQVKSNILDSTLATKGFGEAAVSAVSALAGGAKAVGIFVTGSLLLNGLKSLRTGIQGARLNNAAVGAEKSSGAFFEAVQSSRDKSSAASAALGRGELVNAAQLKASSIWTRVAAEATATHSAALARATEAQGQFNVRTFAGVYLTRGLAGAARVAGMGLRFLAGAAMAALPVILIAAAGAFIQKLYDVADAAEAAVQSQLDLRKSISETTEKLREQVRAAKTIEDWQAAVRSVGEEYRKTLDIINSGVDEKGNPLAGWNLQDYSAKLTRLATQMRDLSNSGGSKGVSKEWQSYADGRSVASFDSRQQRMREDIEDSDGATRVSRLKAQADDLDREGRIGSGIARDEAAFSMSDPGREMALNEQAISVLESSKLGELKLKAEARKKTATEANAKLAEEQAKLATAKEYARMGGGYDAATQQQVNVTEAENAAKEAEASVKAMVEILEQIAKIGDVDALKSRNVILSTGAGARRQLLAQIAKQGYTSKDQAAQLADFNRQVGGADSYAAQSKSNRTEANRLSRGLSYDSLDRKLSLEIAEAQAQGKRTGGLELSRRQKLLQADMDRTPESQPQRRAEIKNQQDLLKQEGISFNRSVAMEMMRNNMTLSGNRKADQAFSDMQDREKLRSEYEANGMTAKQADAMFQQRLMADARNQLPKITTDSLQAIGGGGGVYTGGDPMKAAQDRIEQLNATQVELLANINAGIQNLSLLK